MVLEHLISTMKQNDMSFVEEMNCKEDVLVVNQTDREDFLIFEENGKKRRMISTPERGLSNSRNMLLDNSAGEIVIIGDDDLLYLDGYTDIIRNAYRDYPDADIICFQFSQSLSESTRIPFGKPKRLNIFNISKVASVEITFKRESVVKSGVRFDSLLGLGAPFGSDEENAFLADCLRKGMIIRHIPATICYLKPDDKERIKWKDGFGKDYFETHGGGFYRIYGRAYLFFSLGFILLKKRTLFKNNKVFDMLKWMINGKRKFVKIKRG